MKQLEGTSLLLVVRSAERLPIRHSASADPRSCQSPVSESEPLLARPRRRQQASFYLSKEPEGGSERGSARSSFGWRKDSENPHALGSRSIPFCPPIAFLLELQARARANERAT